MRVFPGPGTLKGTNEIRVGFEMLLGCFSYSVESCRGTHVCRLCQCTVIHNGFGGGRDGGLTVLIYVSRYTRRFQRERVRGVGRRA